MAEQVERTPDEKLMLEVEKLKWEVEHLKRPWIRNPASWLALATTFVAVFGLGIQSCRSSREFDAAKREYDLAKVGKERLELDIEKLGRRRSEFLDEMAVVEGKLATLRRSAEDARSEFVVAQTKFENVASQIPSTPENRSAVAQVVESLSTLRDTSAALGDQTEDTVGNIQEIQEEVGGRLQREEGYIWIGNYNEEQAKWERLQLKDLSGKIISDPVGRFSEEGEFEAIVMGNMELRADAPFRDGSYYHGVPSKGTIRRGTHIRIIEKPIAYERSARLQHWSKIRILE